ncbi:uncharacterized protein LOC142994805 isoform X3 [Genypterus blacodes]|uniref:uncharacterized protein LOC142994805 isoform X3 n=1 Tax=Genypterus blacodes TaxID=154954 RepID=UPI003F76C53D
MAGTSKTPDEDTLDDETYKELGEDCAGLSLDDSFRRLSLRKTDLPAKGDTIVGLSKKRMGKKKKNVRDSDETDKKESVVSLTEVSKLNMDNPKFTPEVFPEAGGISYRFRFPGPGVFHCALTDLVFGVSAKADVLYKTVVWNETLLISQEKEVAGPLFSVQCPQDAVQQLHLPHCQPTPAHHSCRLGVVHISDDKVIGILEPLAITKSHVVVRVPHLSAFGLVLPLKQFFKATRKKKGQILLFCHPPDRKQRQKLNVILLPSNVPLEEVRVQQEGAVYIQTPSFCRLTKGQNYSLLSDSESLTIQPAKAPFHADYGPNYHPTFQAVFSTSTENVHLRVQHQNTKPVWEHVFTLPDACPDMLPRSAGTAAKLEKARKDFIRRVTAPVLNQLLDGLLQLKVINDEEMQFVRGQSQADKARGVIDMVLRKGPQASTHMMSLLNENDPTLCVHLNLV